MIDVDDTAQLIIIGTQEKMHRAAALAALEAFTEHLEHARDAVNEQIEIARRIARSLAADADKPA